MHYFIFYYRNLKSLERQSTSVSNTSSHNSATPATGNTGATNISAATTPPAVAGALLTTGVHHQYAPPHHGQPSPTAHSHLTAPPPPPHAANVLYPSAAYSDHGFLQMTLGYLSPSSGAYKSVDPYFLSQGILSYFLFYSVLIQLTLCV